MNPIKLLLLFILLLLQASPITADFTQAPSPTIPGLITYWSFDHVQNDLVIDDSSHNATGNLVNTIITNDGISGNGVSFNGVNSYILLNDSYLPAFQSFTVAFWFRISSPNTMAQLFGLQNDSYESFGLLINRTNAGYFTWLKDKNRLDSSGGPTFNDLNTWHFYAFSYYDGNITIFLDQSLALGIDYYQPIPFSPEPVLFGISKNSAGLSNAFNGSMDEIRIYDRELTRDEILSLYSLNSPYLSTNNFPADTPLVIVMIPIILILGAVPIYFMKLRQLKSKYSKNINRNSGKYQQYNFVCSNCSAQLDLDDDYCSYCGYPATKGKAIR